MAGAQPLGNVQLRNACLPTTFGRRSRSVGTIVLIHHHHRLTAKQWQLIAPGKNGELQASQSPPGFTNHNDRVPRGRIGGEAANSAPGMLFFLAVYLG
jgi:hypothetical protein